MTHKITHWIMITVFAFNQLSGIKNSYAISDASFLPKPGAMVNLSPAFETTLIKGMTIHKDNPFLFDFIIDSGHDRFKGAQLKKEADRLIKYFFACLTISEKDLWVNLSPYEKDRITPPALGETALGRDLLAQDYMLEQVTASLIYPEKDLGKSFWDKVFAQAQEQFGTTNIPVNTFNKVWIVAEKASVYEHNQTVFVVDGHLKVMLEEDYLATQKNKGQPGDMFKTEQQGTCPQAGCQAKDLTKSKATQGTNVTQSIIKQIILPVIEHEVNTGKNFAMLRQIFYSQILAFWYKRNLKDAILTQVYANKNTVTGINLDDPTVKQAIYERYLQAYKKGVFNFIKETPTANGQTVPRKYFSGGYVGNELNVSKAMTAPENIRATGDYAVATTRADAAQTTEESNKRLEQIAGMFDKSSPAMISTLTDVLVLKNATEEGLKMQSVDDIVLLGNDNFDTFREALQLFTAGHGKRIVITGGVGRLTKSLLEQAKRSGIEVNEGDTEARMIRRVMLHMIDKEEAFVSLRERKSEEIFMLEETSINTFENLRNYKLMIEGQRVNTIIFIQTPHQQLRTVANVKKVFSSRISRGLKVFSWTAPYQEEGKDIRQLAQELSGEAWRLVVYSLARRIKLNGVYPKGLAGIPDNFWSSAASLFDSLPMDQKEELAHQWLDLAKGLDINDKIGQLRPEIKAFVDKITMYSRVHFIFNDHGYLHEHMDAVLRRVREADTIYIETHIASMVNTFNQVSQGRMEVQEAIEKMRTLGGYTALYIKMWSALLQAVYKTNKRIVGEKADLKSEQDILIDRIPRGSPRGNIINATDSSELSSNDREHGIRLHREKIPRGLPRGESLANQLLIDAFYKFLENDMRGASESYKNSIILIARSFYARDVQLQKDLLVEIKASIGTKMLVIRGGIHTAPYIKLREDFPSVSREFLGMNNDQWYPSEQFIMDSYFELAGIGAGGTFNRIRPEYFLLTMIQQFLIYTSTVRNPEAVVNIVKKLNPYMDVGSLSAYLSKVKPTVTFEPYAKAMREWFVTTGKATSREMQEAIGDAAQLPEAPGGIDLKTLQDGMTVKKDAAGGVTMSVDPAMLAQIRREGLKSLVPVIIKMEFLSSISPLLRG